MGCNFECSDVIDISAHKATCGPILHYTRVQHDLPVQGQHFAMDLVLLGVIFACLVVSLFVERRRRAAVYSRLPLNGNV